MVIRLLSLYLVMGVFIASIMLVYGGTTGKKNQSKALRALAISVMIYLFGYLMELNSTILSEMIFWNKFQYLGIPFFSALWLIIAFLYTAPSQHLIGWKGVGIFAIPLFTFFLRLTNDYHHLFYKSIAIKETAGIPLLYLEKGNWYFIQSGYVLIIFVISTILFYRGFRRSQNRERLKFRLLFMASALPYLALILIILDFQKTGLDYAALILPVSAGLIVIAIARYDFLEIKVMAREKIFEDSSAGMLLLNNQYRVMDYNRACIVFFELFGANLKEEYLDILLKDQQELLEIIKRGTLTHQILDKNGEKLYVQITSKVIDKKLEQYGYLITFEDITERELLQKQLTALACSDELSGLDNRRCFMQKADIALERAVASKENLTVAMMDLDHFKYINDTFGHGGGDYAIREFSKLLRSHFGENDLTGRMGGEEFAVVLSRLSQEEAFKRLDDFRKSLEAYEIRYENQEIPLTVSIGIAHISEESLSMDDILNRADKALYQSKLTGRNRTTQ